MKKIIENILWSEIFIIISFLLTDMDALKISHIPVVNHLPVNCLDYYVDIFICNISPKTTSVTNSNCNLFSIDKCIFLGPWLSCFNRKTIYICSKLFRNHAPNRWSSFSRIVEIFQCLYE